MKSVMNLRSLPSLMRGWQLESLSGIGAMNFREDLNVPILTTPNDVLVKVEASSVNPLDVMMTKGYGNSVLSNLRSDNIGKYILLSTLLRPLDEINRFYTYMFLTRNKKLYSEIQVRNPHSKSIGPKIAPLSIT